eukprot:IDg14629t1
MISFFQKQHMNQSAAKPAANAYFFEQTEQIVRGNPLSQATKTPRVPEHQDPLSFSSISALQPYLSKMGDVYYRFKVKTKVLQSLLDSPTL